MRRPTTRAVLTRVTALAATVLLAAGCTGGEYDATVVPSPSGPAAATPAPPSAAPACDNPLASYGPDGPLPAAGTMPAGSTMAKIQQRGRLIAGVSADTLRLGARNPITGAIEGFDIEMLKAVALAIFGRSDPKLIELRVITSAQRITALKDGSIDIVARNMTINCERWQQIAFSSEYYRAGQKVLVPLDSTATGMEDLRGKRVCAPNASTSLARIATVPGVTAVGSDTHTGCLVQFQQGMVDAITGDDTVLAGLAAQDPYARVMKGKAFTMEPYGLGIAKGNIDFVRFVNGVLEQLRADGRWTTSYNTWLKDSLGPAPAPPKPVYGRTS